MNPRRWISLLLLTLAGCAPVAAPAPTAAPSPLPSHTAAPAPTSPRATADATAITGPTAGTDAACCTATPIPTFIPTPTAAPSLTPAPLPTAALTPTPTLVPLDAAERERVFDEAWELVRKNYVYEDYRGLDWDAVRAELLPRVSAAADSDAFYAVMYELIERLDDQHSGFESPQDVAAAEAEYDGELRYGGIGARIRAVEDGGLISWIVPGGPADLAGVKPREVVTAINGVPFATARNDTSCTTCAVRGPPGTTVRLTLRSGTTFRDVTLVRALLSNNEFDNVEGQIISGTRAALVRIPTFYRDGVAAQTRQKIEELSGDGRLDALIVDVRDNSGGSVGQLLETVALFVDGGSIGSARGRAGGGELNLPPARTIPTLQGVPIAVLVSSETASAAEIFAAGMRARGRAVVVGTRSSGNTENLIAHDLSDGSRLWLAERYYRLPDGSDIEGRGVPLDATVDVEYWRYAAEDDPQVQAALRLMK